MALEPKRIVSIDYTAQSYPNLGVFSPGESPEVINDI